MWPTVPVVCPGGFDFTGVEALRFGEFEALDAGDVEGHPAVAVRRVGHGFLRRWCRADARATKTSRSTEDLPAGAQALESRPRAAKVAPRWLLSAAPSLNSTEDRCQPRRRPSRVLAPPRNADLSARWLEAARFVLESADRLESAAWYTPWLVLLTRSRSLALPVRLGDLGQVGDQQRVVPPVEGDRPSTIRTAVAMMATNTDALARYGFQLSRRQASGAWFVHVMHLTSKRAIFRGVDPLLLVRQAFRCAGGNQKRL